MRIFPFVFMVLTFANVSGQGCSDPGLCTIGSLNTEASKDSVSSVDFTNADMEILLVTPFTAEKYRFTLGLVFGAGDEDVKILSNVFQIQGRVREKLVVNIKVPYNYTWGSLGHVNGLGDITMSVENIIYSGKNKRLAYTVGAVLPSGGANIYYQGNPLPMAYQTTLGAINLLGGISLAYKNWSSSIGYQRSFGENENDFVSDNLELNPLRPDYDPLNVERAKYPNARKLRRGSDIMVRVERKFDLGKGFGIAVGALPIFRLNESIVTLTSGETQEVSGTSGLTFNVTAGMSHFKENKWIFRLNGGLPLKIRDESADGLYRKFVVIGSVAYRMW